MALVETLEENKKLVQRIEKLEVENRICKEIVDEMRTLIEVLQVILLIILYQYFLVKPLFYFTLH